MYKLEKLFSHLVIRQDRDEVSLLKNVCLFYLGGKIQLRRQRAL